MGSAKSKIVAARRRKPQRRQRLTAGKRASPMVGELRNSGTRQGRNVAILQNHPVVALMTGNDEGQSQGSNFVLAGYAATKPGRGVQRTHECDRRLAN